MIASISLCPKEKKKLSKLMLKKQENLSIVLSIVLLIKH